MDFNKERYDVVICGGGPAGLLVAYGLQRMNISTCVIERLDKPNMPMYGRACTLYPRTLEMLDQYELLHEFNQTGFIARNSVNYDKEGRRDNSRGWQSMFQDMGTSFLDYCLNIRLKYSEEIIQAHYEKLGGFVAVGWELNAFQTVCTTTIEHPVSIDIKDVKTTKTKTVYCKYLIGADGGQSTIKRLAGIQSDSDKTCHRWVRIDAVVDTDMPDCRAGFASIESPTHGNVLWVNLDHGRTRIGFALNEALHEKYGDSLTQEQAVEEAKVSMLPFKVNFQQVDWYTVYTIRQSVANNYIRDRVILVGDACHTHSSGTAQGMNTGIHDAVNLSWKLAGVLKGWFKDEVLATYENERRPSAQHLIQLDKTFSSLISGTIPEELKSVSPDANYLLKKAWTENTAFSIGLGVKYSANLLNQSTRCGNITSGMRSPDARIFSPGATVPIRLQQVTVNTGDFYVVVFTGEPFVSSANLKKFRSEVDATVVRRMGKFLTIINGNKPQADEVMGVRRFGDAYYDHDGSAHTRYGMDHLQGGYAVLRPDGILGFAARLEDAADLSKYFDSFVLPGLTQKYWGYTE